MQLINNIFINLKKFLKKVLENGPFYYLTFFMKLLLIFSIIFIIYLLLPTKLKFYLRSKIYKESKSHKNYSNNIEIDDIFYSLDTNTNLEFEEKEFIKKYLRNEILDNEEYIDAKLIQKRLKTLKVYNYNEKKYSFGRYNSFFNQIDISNKEINLQEIDYKKIYFHEINHVISKNTLENNFKVICNNESILNETINEIFTIKYLYDCEEGNNSIYSEYLPYTYKLLEILPENVIKEYKFSGDEFILVNGLLQIDNNFNNAYNLIELLNKSYNIENKNKQAEINSKIDELFEYYY